MHVSQLFRLKSIFGKLLKKQNHETYLMVKETYYLLIAIQSERVSFFVNNITFNI